MAAQELQRSITVACEKPRSSFIKLLKSANIRSWTVTDLDSVWKRLRKVSHPTARVMKNARDSVTYRLFAEGKLRRDHRRAASLISARLMRSLGRWPNLRCSTIDNKSRDLSRRLLLDIPCDAHSARYWRRSSTSGAES